MSEVSATAEELRTRLVAGAASADKDLRSASRAVREATAELNRVLRRKVTDATTQTHREVAAVTSTTSQVTREIAEELRQATKDINEAVQAASARLKGNSSKAERTRSELLAAAARVFAEKGYEGASVGDVATAAGYTKGALYANFDSKEALLLALAREALANDEARTQIQDLTVSEAFTSCVDSPEHTANTLLGLELYLYGIRHPQARGALVPLLAQSQDLAAGVVRRTRSGEGEPTQEDQDLGFALTAIHTFGAIVAALDPDGGVDERIQRLMDRLVGDPSEQTEF
jgi:AcrR family transcriptional regulator